MKALVAARPEWLLFEQDECWFSRFAQPNAYAWAVRGKPVRLVQRSPAPQEACKALACYGAVRHDTEQVYLTVCGGQPTSEPTWEFLQGLLAMARQEGKQVVVVIWDHASWHKSERLRHWIRNYNLQAKREDDVRLITFLLPTKSPWLNPIEPRWIHAKRKVCEPDGDLTPDELTRRLFAHFETEPLAELVNT